MTSNPTPLEDYRWVDTPRGWAIQDTLNVETMEAAIVLGFQLDDGVWRGLALSYPQASELALALGNWLTQVANFGESNEDQS